MKVWINGSSVKKSWTLPEEAGKTTRQTQKVRTDAEGYRRAEAWRIPWGRRSEVKAVNPRRRKAGRKACQSRACGGGRRRCLRPFLKVKPSMKGTSDVNAKRVKRRRVHREE